jgi:phosphoribosyl isomerase A
MTFALLPAVDVADGRAVRLAQGRAIDASSTSTYGSPIDAALAWQESGAEWIHLVDIDAAFGRGTNFDLLAGVVGKLDVKVELAGGIRDDASLQRALSTGCTRAVLATTALSDLAWCARVISAYGDRVAVGIDVSVVKYSISSTQHRLVARGGTGDSGDLWETIGLLDLEGCARYVVTDVSKDGMLLGPNVELYREVCRVTRAPVIASGGISSIADLLLLAETAAAGSNLEGSIVGKALYANRFTLAAALAAMRATLR